MSNHGHNENAVRLSALAGDALVALDKVAKGEADANEGWMAYGAALNEGRAMFPGDAEFGRWVSENALSQLGTQEVKRDERVAAMWIAANADQVAEARAASNARTPRGLHAKWKEIEAERERIAAEAERKSKAEADRKTKAEEAQKAEELAKAKEAEARAAAEAAKSDEQKADAEAKAAEAEKAAAEAKAKAEAAKAKTDEPKGDPDPYAKERKALSKFTREGLEDELIETRVAFKDEKAKRKKAEADNRHLKERLKEHNSDKDESIRRQAATISHQRGEVERANQKFEAEKRKTYVLNKEIKQRDKRIQELEHQLENQVIPL